MNKSLFYVFVKGSKYELLERKLNILLFDQVIKTFKNVNGDPECDKMI